MWRPDDWENPHKIGEPLNWAAVNEADSYAAFEAGADAILEELRRGGFFLDGRKLDLNQTGVLNTVALMNLTRRRKGMVVFIPEEVE